MGNTSGSLRLRRVSLPSGLRQPSTSIAPPLYGEGLHNTLKTIPHKNLCGFLNGLSRPVRWREIWLLTPSWGVELRWLLPSASVAVLLALKSASSIAKSPPSGLKPRNVKFWRKKTQQWWERYNEN